MKKKFLLLLLLVLLTACLVAGTMNATAFARTEIPWVLGDTVQFAGHSWRIIGTETEGVTAPSGYYTLFIADLSLGYTAYRANSSSSDSSAGNYSGSDLQIKIEEFANTFSAADKANILPRNLTSANDEISGPNVNNQYLWALSESESMWLWRNMQFSSSQGGQVYYWTRTSDFDSNEITVFNGNLMGYGDTFLPNWYDPNTSSSIRPAMYVKISALPEKENSAVTGMKQLAIGGEISFAGQNWYIVGMGDNGPVPGPTNTVTLLAASVINDDDDNVVYVNTAKDYADGDLCTQMNWLAETMGYTTREKSLIVNRTLTTDDGISGNSVTTPFWPLSKEEYEAIYEFDSSMGACSNAFYWLRTGYGDSAAYHVDNKGKVDWNYVTATAGMRPACYLDLSELIFAAEYWTFSVLVGFTKEVAYPSDGLWNFVLPDDTLSLSLTGASTQSGSSLNFQYYATTGTKNYVSYVLEYVGTPGVPVYYGKAASIGSNVSGTATVNLASNVADGNYTLRFYVEDNSSDWILFAGNTVDLTIKVQDGVGSITDLGDVNPAAAISGVTVTPSSQTVEVGTWQQFSAAVTSNGSGWYDTSVTWSISGASAYTTNISQTGLLTVAKDETATSITVTATSNQDNSKSATASVKITPHVHVGTFVAGTPATCTTEGLKDYYRCESCYKVFEDADCTTEITYLDTWRIISPLGHDFVWTYNGDGTHTGVCQRDGCEETVTDNCSGGEATFFHPAICEVCGGEYIAQKIYKATIDFDGQTYYYETFDEAVDALGEFSTTAEKRAVLKLFDNVDLTSSLTFNTGFITLDLNGYMLKQTGSGSVISIGEGADFILDDLSGATATHKYYVAEDGLWTFYDGDLPEAAPDGAETGVVTGGVLTGGNALYGGGVSVYGTFTMNDGTISGNVATSGGGVYMGDGSTFTMNGGTISGNKAGSLGGGVYVGYSGNFLSMSGGTISDNNAGALGDVYVAGGSFTMENGYCNSINIANSTFSFSGGNCDSVIISGGTVSISYGYIGSVNITKGTVSISGGYFAEEFNEAYLAEKCVLQDVSALGGATFDGDYKDGFPYAVYAQGGILISTNKDIVYDGSPVAEGVDFTVEGTDGVTLTYSYKAEGGDEFTAGLPTNAGEYAVSVYALNGEKQFISMVFDITIAKATYDMSGISFADGNFTYDKEAHSIAISGTLPGGVSVSYDVSYKVNAGEYTVTATFTGDSANYNAIPVMTAKLTIAKADYDMSDITFEGGSFTYDGQAHSLAIAGNLPYGVSVNYINNAQVNAGEHTVTAKFTGDYTNYNTIDDMTAMLTIDKAMPVYTTPENLTICVEHTLADVTLPAGWTWEDGTLSVGETGEKQFKAIFTPEDTNNYERALVNVTLTVAEHIDENDDGICDSCGVKFRNIVTVAGGTIEGVTGSTCTVDENGSVTVVVGEAPEGKEFKGWSVDGGETIISEEAAFTFTASEDMTLTAVFADKQSDVKPGGEITPETPENEPAGLSGGAIAGIVIGCILGTVLICYLVFGVLYKKQIMKGKFFDKIYPFIK